MRAIFASWAAFPVLLGLVACGSTATDGGDEEGLSSGGTPSSGGALGSSGGAGSGSGGTGSGAGGTGGGGTSAATGPVVMGYILDLEEWGGAGAIDDLDFSAVDYVIHAFYTSDGSNQVVSVDSTVDAYRSALVTQVHAAGKRIVMSLGGANHSFVLKQIAADPARIPPFVANVVAKLNEYGYDGFDLDMEFPAGGNEPAQQLALMTALYDAVKANNSSHLAMFGAPPGYYLDQFQWSLLGAKSDYAFYFCYDWDVPANGPMKNPGTDFTMFGGTDLSEASCSAALNYVLGSGYPAAQIVVGLPFYANGGAHYSTIPGALKTTAPDVNFMEVSDGGGGWWPTATGTVMKIDAVLDPTKSVLTGQATVGGVGYWEWGYENPAVPELSQAIKARVIDSR